MDSDISFQVCKLSAVIVSPKVLSKMPVLSKLKQPIKDPQSIPRPPVRRYRIKHLAPEDEGQSHNPEAWTDKGHTITVISPTNSHVLDKTNDNLFVNHVHIHPDNWNWLDKPNELLWKQGVGDDLTEGHIGMSPDPTEGGHGLVQFKQSDPLGSAQLVTIKPTVSLDVSSNAGASLSASSMTPTWDTTSKKWKNAHWDEDVLKYTYWVASDGENGVLVRSTFLDVAKNITWSPNERNDSDPPLKDGEEESSGYSTVVLTKTNLLTFSSDSEPTPGSEEIMPSVMCLQFDGIGTSVTGGGMINATDSTVCALRGQVDADNAVGSYTLIGQDSRVHDQKFVTHGSKLIIDGGAIPSSNVFQNKLKWKNLTPSQQKKSGLPQSGHVEFSRDGNFIVGSSFSAKGFRDQSERETGLNDAFHNGRPLKLDGEDSTALKPEYRRDQHIKPGVSTQPEAFPAPSFIANAQSNLSVVQLMNMDPTAQNADQKMVNKAQQRSMNNFYSILQYYMPQNYLDKFIGSRPDIGDLEGIANFDKDKTEKFYSDLAVPYLVGTLKNSATEKSVKKLNARRAEKYLTNGVTQSPVYRQQASEFYSYNWKKLFPIMEDFCEDQKHPTAEQLADIDKESEQWRKNITSDLSGDVANDLHAMVTNVTANAKNKKYWAFKLFKRLCSPGSLAMTKMKLELGVGTLTVATVQRYDAIFRMLDSSGEFSKRYQEVLNMMSISTLLAKKKSYGNDSYFKEYCVEIMKRFVKDHASTKNAHIQQRVADINHAIQTNSLLEYANLFVGAASESGGKWIWQQIISKFTSKCKRVFGNISVGVLDAVAALGAISTISFLVTGKLEWNDMSALQKTGFVTSCISMLSVIVRKGMKIIAIFRSYNTIDAFRVILGKEAKGSVKLATGFRKWILGNTPKKPKGRAAIQSAESIDSELVIEEEVLVKDNLGSVSKSKLAKFFGKDLDTFMANRFAVVMSVIGIGLSIWGIVEAKGPLDRASSILFTLSSALDLAIAAGSIAIEIGVGAVTEMAITSISSVLGPLAIVGAIAGFILMMVKLFGGSTPPDPVDEFVESDVVKNSGYYMPHETAIDYFQVSTLENNGWISFQAGGKYLSVSEDGKSFTMVPQLDYSYRTLFTVSTDYNGDSKVITKVMTEMQDGSNKLTFGALTLDDKMVLQVVTRAIDNDDKKRQQLWTIDCQGSVGRDKDEHLQSADFSLENKFHNGYYLGCDSDYVQTKQGQKSNWKLTKVFEMKPSGLTLPDITTGPTGTSATSTPSLEQGGSSSYLKWDVSPPLPEFLTMSSKGEISMTKKAGTSFKSQQYTMTVTNTEIPSNPSASAQFKVQIVTSTE